MNPHAQFYVLLKQMPHADKASLVNTYSNGKTISLREFYKSDLSGYERMLADMAQSVTSNQPVTPKNNNDPEKRRYRSLILRAMQDQGVMVINRDWSPVNKFVERYAGAGKTLNNMSLDELKKFNQQVHSLLEWHKSKKEKETILALMN